MLALRPIESQGAKLEGNVSEKSVPNALDFGVKSMTARNCTVIRPLTQLRSCKIADDRYSLCAPVLEEKSSIRKRICS